MSCQSINNETCDISIVANRWGSSVLYSEMLTLDSSLFLFDCLDIAAIDTFLMTECSMNMNATQVQFTRDLIAYEDGVLDRDDIRALDTLFIGMVTTGKDCTTYQGDLSGCI
ncbi:hypothetical protein [Sulfuricurvum sp.]|uniref:hypothetical protein n=1 Tax=Sulfuricurvum sp. TaxID=2025608 RepID=UPI00260B6118|nr:hypothetical protein [Sulfuricurvum sp.]MDD2267653.1 hypothetical protein [Sulfuricurvum sp.]MDD2784258.1 hypothetical protein [Sulfuricurvum sp.]